MLKKGVPEWMSSGSSIWSSLSSSLSPKSKPNSPLSESASPGTRTGPESETPSSPPALEPPLLQSPPVRVAGGDPSRSEEISLQSQLLAELSKKVIDLGELRRLASQGIPDGAGIRSTVWKLVLGYLPNDRSLWVQELSKKRSQYKAFKEDFLVNPSEIAWILDETAGRKDEELDNKGKGLLSRSQITHGEHPLSLGQTSVWNKFFQDTEIIEQIDRDVKRTHPDMHFFSGDSSLAKSNQEALKHILIIFAKLNPGIKYVQGMNEVLAPLYYVFRSDPDENNAAHAEADTFFCFVELLSGFRDNFCQKLDNSVVGIRSTLSKLMQLLKTHDGELWSHLEITTKAHAEADTFFCFVELLSGFRDNFCQKLDNSVVGIRSTLSKLMQLLKTHDGELWSHLEITTKVNPQFYAFRWITLLLTQEFNFADSLHIWDTLLSDPDGPQETLLRVCCAMLLLVRRRLLAGDFTSNLKLLQHYPSANISHLLYVANKLREP